MILIFFFLLFHFISKNYIFLAIRFCTSRYPFKKNFFCLAKIFTHFHIHLKSLKMTNSFILLILDDSFTMLIKTQLSILLIFNWIVNCLFFLIINFRPFLSKLKKKKHILIGIFFEQASRSANTFLVHNRTLKFKNLKIFLADLKIIL